MSKRRQYSDAEKAETLAALDANGGDVSHTARQTGVPRTTIQEWAAGRGTHPSVTELRQEKRRDLADEIEELAYQLVGAMPGKIARASLQQLALTLGISIDKMRLLREQATSIQGQDGMSDSDRAGRIAALLDAGRERRDRLAAGGGSGAVN